MDAKIISKLLAKRLKNVLSPLISDNQTAYVNGRFISEGGRLISDILEISDMLNLKGLLLTVDIQKAFDCQSPIFNFSFKEIWFWKYFYQVDTNSTKKLRILCY